MWSMVMVEPEMAEIVPWVGVFRNLCLVRRRVLRCRLRLEVLALVLAFGPVLVE